jgi:flagellar assembly protein FliH
VQAERRVARGGAIVRTVEGEVDATLQTKLTRAREALEAELRGDEADGAPIG